MGVGFVIFGLLIAIFSLMMLGVCIQLRDAASNKDAGRQSAKVSHWTTGSLLVAPLCGIGAAGFLWINAVHSYYCVTPANVLFHSSMFSRSRLVTWDDARIVHPMRRSGKSSHWCSLHITFATGQEIYLPLSHGNDFFRQDYDRARALLAGKKYKYGYFDNVTTRLCPPELYILLMNWRV
jgi:hypothetical protein